MAGLVFWAGTVSAQPHKLRVADPALATALSARGARLIADYGGFQVMQVASELLPMAPSPSVERVDHFDVIELNAQPLPTPGLEARALRRPRGGFAGKRLHLIQFVGPVKSEWYAELEQCGVQTISYLPHNAYLVYGEASALAAVQVWAGTNPVVQWEGEYADEFKIQPCARAARANTSGHPVNVDTFAVQLVADDEANAATLALIERLKLAPIENEFRLLRYRNIMVRLPPERLAEVAARPEVVSIQAYPPRRKVDERQNQIVAGNLLGDVPGGPGYLDWLAAKGFSQAQFSASGFAVDVSDSGIDNGTISPGHFGLYQLGNPSLPSRVVYTRLVGKPNRPGSTLQGCDGHGTLNAHIIGGYNDLAGAFPHRDASGFGYGLGVCPFVRVGSSVIFDPEKFTKPNYTTLQSRAYHDGARISNNSWGAAVAGAYDVDAQTYDALVRDAQPAGAAYPAPGNQQMVIVFAAGNEGPGAQTVNSPGSAKNVITVGASENVRSLSTANGGNNPAGNDACGTPDSDANSAADMTDFSSRGPCKDGRMKPDLVAPGTHITGGVAQTSPPPSPAGTGSAIPCFDSMGVCALPGSGTPGDPDNFFPLGQQFYTVSTGTSHSAPAVAGACALLRQYFINLGLPPPSPAMTKAFLINSARYLTGAYANDHLWSPTQGMGAVNLGMAFDETPRLLRDQVTADKFTATGQTRTFVGAVADPAKPFRVTIAWTDAPGSTVGSAYKNDLDLTVAVAGNTYKGNVFSGAFSTPGGSADPRNNVESVFLPAGFFGPFTVTVTAANINSDGVPNEAPTLDQDFALVICNAVQPADLVLGASCGADAVNLGTPVELTLRVTNLGPSEAANAILTNVLPPGLAFVSATASQGSWSHVAGVVIFNLGTIGPGVTATATLQANTVRAGWWTNTATISSPTPDLNLANNSLRAVLFVNSPPTISGLEDVETDENVPAGPFPFTIGDAETPPADLRLGAIPADTNLVHPAGIEFGGAESNRTITITPMLNQTGSTTIAVTVSDGLALATNAFVFTVRPVNHAPVLAPIPDQLVHALMRVSVTNVADDPDAPPQTLQFSLHTNAPVGAGIDPGSGIFEWTPTEADVGTNFVTVRVTDNGQPPLDDVRTFAVVVFPRPVLQAGISTNALVMRWSAIPGLRYQVEFKSGFNEAAWQELGSEVLAADFVAQAVDTLETAAQRFYRVRVVE